LDIKTGLILLLFPFLLAAAAPDKKLLSKSNYIVHVTLSDGSDYIVYRKDPPHDAAVITAPSRPLLLAPEWKFYYQKEQNRTIALATLGSETKRFDASGYNRIDLDGHCHDCQVALADQRLYEKEDNYIIGSFKPQINLDKIRHKLDLGKLKYLVVLAKRREDINITSLLFHNQFSTYRHSKTALSVWAWSAQDIDLHVLKKHAVKRVYLQVGPGFEKMAKLLYDQGLTVYALDGDPHDIFDPKRLQKSLQRVAALNKKAAVISGFQLDVEPHVLPGFNLHKEEYTAKLVSLLSTLSQEVHHNGLQFSVVTPFWYDTVLWKSRPLVHTVIDLADETVLMSYRSNVEDVLRISENELVYASLHQKSVRIGVELMPIPDEEHQVYKLGKKEPCITLGSLENECRELIPYSNYTVKGSTLSFYKQQKPLEKLLHTQVQYPAFKGFVLHQMRALH